MKLNEYQNYANRTAQTKLSFPQELCNYGLGIVGEAAETSEMVKKAVFHGHVLNRHKLAEELGDCLWYISQLARLSDFTLEQIAEMNVSKLRKRYTEGFNSEESINREL